MRAIIYAGRDELEWRERPEPAIAGDGEAIVAPLAVATCDLDDLIVSGRSPFAPPFALGHEGVGEIVEVGEAVTSFAPGDRVVIPFQINCGECGPCRQGRTGNCASVPFGSTYGFGFGPEGTRWGGFLADLVHVPYAEAMLIPLPAGLAPEVAAGASDNITDGYRTVGGPLAARPGAPVLVVGGAAPGSIGLYAIAQAIALGSLDRVASRSHSAAWTATGSAPRSGSTSIRSRSPAFRCSRCTSRTTFVTGRLHARRDAPRVLELLADGRLDPEPVTTRVVGFDEAADALTDHGYTKLVFTP